MVTFIPSYAEEEITWTSSNSSIASIDADGKVTGMKEGTCKVYGAEMLIGEVLRNGYESLGVSGINEPFRDWSNTDYTYWEDADGEIYEGCEYCGKTECPEDILSAECPRSGDAWAVERIAYAVNEVLECSL